MLPLAQIRFGPETVRFHTDRDGAISPPEHLQNNAKFAIDNLPASSNAHALGSDGLAILAMALHQPVDEKLIDTVDSMDAPTFHALATDVAAVRKANVPLARSHPFTGMLLIIAMLYAVHFLLR